MDFRLNYLLTEIKLRFSFRIKLLFILLSYLLLPGCSDQKSENTKNITFEVVLPTSSRDSAVYITGNREELGNWKADEVALTKTPEGIYRKTLQLKKGSHIEYKFTRGSWETEAANPDGSIPGNSVLDVSNDTVITVFIGYWMKQNFNGTVNLPYNAFNNPIQMYYLSPYWKYHTGDDTAWASPEYDDKDWKVRSTLLAPLSDSASVWNGIGWFRLHIYIDSTLVGKPVHLLLDHFGSAEIYLNGKFVRRFGVIGNPPSAEINKMQRGPVIISFDKANDQLLAVRYSNFLTMPLKKYKYNTGFNTILGDAEKFITIVEASNRRTLISEMFFAGIPFILALIHLLFFVFYPSDKSNLFYGLCLICFSFSFFFFYQRYFTESPQTLFLYNNLALFNNPFIVLFGLLSAYFAFKDRNPIKITLFSFTAIVLAVWAYSSPTRTATYAFYAYIILIIFELFRLMLFSKSKREGSRWIIGTGFGILAVTLIYSIITDIGLIKPFSGVTIDPGYGMLALIISQSINLSLGFARTHKNLERQLKHVRELSEKALEQERIARRQEMEKKLLEADNDRKTRELEEARRMQLSMLPKVIPVVKDFEIAAFMKTATEVGGDYYDFKTMDSGTFITAIGDATGHGTKAGTMVTILKILFNQLSDAKDLVSVMHKFTDAIKLMNLNQLYMGLTLLEIKDLQMKLASAGMPPVMLYHAESNCVEEIIIKGMPLGSFADFPYQQKEFRLFPGDIILLMSDGYMEQFNGRKEMLGQESIKKTLQNSYSKAPQAIIEDLVRNLESWQGDAPQQDDVTFVVLKVK